MAGPYLTNFTAEAIEDFLTSMPEPEPEPEVDPEPTVLNDPPPAKKAVPKKPTPTPPPDPALVESQGEPPALTMNQV